LAAADLVAACVLGPAFMGFSIGLGRRALGVELWYHPRFGRLLAVSGLIRSARTRTRGVAVFGAVLPEHRGRHIATMAARFFRGLEEMGFTKALYLSRQRRQQRLTRSAEAIGARGRILYHCFAKYIRV
jgi:hypothetical protein